ncbi:MAG: ABC transporter permease [Ignavibacteriaceae bacterium]|nr:ABC transporter permease [Ignavibacteriaceae bacterium]
MRQKLRFTIQFLSPRKSGTRMSLFSTIVIAGIALGVTTLIIALSVLSGFESTIREKLISLDSHIQITGFSDRQLPDTTRNIQVIRSITGEKLEAIYPVISNAGIAGKGKLKEGIVIRGVSGDYLAGKHNLQISSGDFNLTSGELPAAVVGKTVADKLFIKQGDAIILFLPEKGLTSTLSPENIAVQRFRVSGIFENGMAKYDDSFIYININTAAGLLGFENSVSSYELKLNTIAGIDTLVNNLQDNLDYPHYVRSVFDINQALLTWIDLQKKPIPIVLGLIILVAAFNIISAILVLILSKVNSIGTLRVLGMKRSDIVTMFLLKGLLLGTGGIAIGNLLALLLSAIQLEFNIITLPASVYFVSRVPLSIDPFNYLITSGIAFLLVLIISVVPAFLAASIRPVQSVRFD